MAIPERTVAEMLAVVCEAAQAEDLPRAIVTGFERVLGVDYATYDEFGPDGARAYAQPAPPEDIAAAYGRYGEQHPSLVHYRTRGGTFTRRLSDIATQRALRRLGLWAQVFRPLGIRHQLNLPLHDSGRRVIGVGLSRTGRDFSDDELAAVELLRVELARIVAARQGPRPDALVERGLTAREAEVLSLAVGRTSAEIAGLLVISKRTVEKHLEHAFRKLGVSSRAEAVRTISGRTL